MWTLLLLIQTGQLFEDRSTQIIRGMRPPVTKRISEPQSKRVYLLRKKIIYIVLHFEGC